MNSVEGTVLQTPKLGKGEKIKISLDPFGNGHIHLNKIELLMDQNNYHTQQSTVLGRNSMTGLDQPCDHIQHVSRSHVIITCRNGKVFMDAVARQDHIVHLNGVPCERGEIEIHSGDEISLLGTLLYFNYKVNILPVHHVPIEVLSSPGHTQEIDDEVSLPNKRQKLGHDSEIVAAIPVEVVGKQVAIPSSSEKKVVEVGTVAPSSSSVTTTTGDTAMIESLLRQYECEICYEVMACAFSLVPCGDCFCFCCIEDWARGGKKNCPHCHGEFDLKNAIPNKKIDNAIREVLKNDKEQVSLWEKRVEEGLQRRRSSMEAPSQTVNNTNSTSVTGPVAIARGNSILSHFRFTNPAGVTITNQDANPLDAFPVVIPPARSVFSAPVRRRGGGTARTPVNSGDAPIVDLTKESQPPQPIIPQINSVVITRSNGTPTASPSATVRVPPSRRRN